MEEVLELWRGRLRAFWNTAVRPALDLRTVVLTVLGLWLLAADWKAAKALAFGLGMALIALAFLHWTRKTLNPYLDLSRFAEKAAEDPLASAIVLGGYFAFVIGFLGFLLLLVVR